LRELLYDIDDALVPLFILTDVLDGFFRYLADVLETHCGFAEEDFWQLSKRALLAMTCSCPSFPVFASTRTGSCGSAMPMPRPTCTI
jgi:siderophore synthetase component